MADSASYYKVLGLGPDASQEQVRQAFRELARQWHPDTVAQNPESLDVALEKMKELNAAYEFLRSHRREDAAGGSRGTADTRRAEEAEELDRRIRLIGRFYLETREQQRRINNALCRECGQPLTRIDKLLGRQSHGRCRPRASP